MKFRFVQPRVCAWAGRVSTGGRGSRRRERPDARIAVVGQFELVSARALDAVIQYQPTQGRDTTQHESDGEDGDGKDYRRAGINTKK